MKRQSMGVRFAVPLRVLLIAMITLLFVGNLTLTQTDEDALAIAQDFMQLLINEDYEAAVALYDETMMTALPPEALQELWEGLIGQVGPYQQELGASVAEIQGYQVVTVISAFELLALNINIPIDSDGRVAGLNYVPNYDPPEPGGTNEPKLPDYVDPDAFTEVEVIVGGMTEWELPGTLTLPVGEGPFPAVVLVHGSGSSDRDSTVGPNKPFRDIAQGLASNGIAVLRYDKRNWYYEADLFDISTFTVQDESIDDALQAVALLRETDGIDTEQIYVLGHSQGGMVTPRIGDQDDGIAGLIIAAGFTRSLIDMIVEQTNYLINLDGEVSEEEAAVLAEYEAGLETIRGWTEDTDPAEIVMGAGPVYWLDLRDYDPVAMAQDYPNPILILQGERDYQVTLEDLAGWQAGLADRDDVTIITYSALNHLFMAGEGAPNNTEYFVPGFVDAGFIADVAAWILAQSAD